jgi:hypothetical protein
MNCSGAFTPEGSNESQVRSDRHRLIGRHGCAKAPAAALLERMKQGSVRDVFHRRLLCWIENSVDGDIVVPRGCDPIADDCVVGFSCNPPVWRAR